MRLPLGQHSLQRAHIELASGRKRNFVRTVPRPSAGPRTDSRFGRGSKVCLAPELIWPPLLFGWQSLVFLLKAWPSEGGILRFQTGFCGIWFCFPRFCWAYEGVLPLLFISCWSYRSDAHGGGGKNWQGREPSVQTRVPPAKVTFWFQLWRSGYPQTLGQNRSTSDMNCTEVFFLTNSLVLTDCAPRQLAVEQPDVGWDLRLCSSVG